MNFSNVKQWFINNSEVKSMAINGTIMWQKPVENDEMVVTVSGSGEKRFCGSTFTPASFSQYIDEITVYDTVNNEEQAIQIWKYGVTSTWVSTYNFVADGVHEIHIKFRQEYIDSTTQYDGQNVVPYSGNFYVIPPFFFRNVVLNSIERWQQSTQVICGRCFEGCKITEGAPQLPPNLLIVWYNAFYQCDNIAKTTGVIDFGGHLTSLGKYMLSDPKTNLTHVILRHAMVDDGVDRWFNSYSIFCNDNFDVVVTDGCTRFCQYLFSNTGTSMKVYCLSTTPPTFPTPVGTIKCTFYVPVGYGSVYQAAWSGIVDSSKIVEGACPYNV